MGNAASKDPADAAAGHYGRPQYPAAMPRKDVYAPPPLAPAALGPAGQPPRFEIISPASDLSNPSNLDRLKRSRQYERARARQQTPVRERRRTSKVMTARNGTGRLVTNQRTTALPAPDGFYFAPTAAPLAAAAPLPPPEADKENFAMRKNAAAREPAHLAALAHRAKQALQGCLQHTHDAVVASNGNYERRHPRHHERLSSVPPSIEVQPMMEPVSEIRHPAPFRRTAGRNRRSSTSDETDEDDLLYEQEHSELIQFDAAQPNYLGVMRNPYLHSEDSYFRSLARPSAAAPQPQQQELETHEPMEEETAIPSSPVMQLFVESERVSRQSDEAPSAIENHHDYWLACVLQISAAHKKADMEERKQRKRSLESTAAASETSAPVDAARHRRHRASSSSTGISGTAQALDARRMSAEEFRHSVEALVQQQIDAQLAAQLTQKLRIQGPEGKQELRAAPSSQEPTTITSSSDGTGAQKKRQYFQRRALQRSNSMPLVTDQTDAAKTSRVGRSMSQEPAARKRSSSVPSRRLSTATSVNATAVTKNEIPALLRLAGWEPSAVAAPIFKKEEKPVVVKDPIDNFPALLKLAGWQEVSGPRKRRYSRLSIQSALPRLQRNKRLTMTFANRSNRRSEPIPTTQPLPGASKSRRILAVEPAREGRHSAADSAPVFRFDQHSTQGNAPSHNFGATQVPASTFSVGTAPKPVGLTTATMLQQTYGISAAAATYDAELKSILSHDLETISENNINLDAQALLPAKAGRVTAESGGNRDLQTFSRLLGSPAMSYCSIDSQRSPIFGSPVPLVSGQATSNAEFLFASAGKADRYPGDNRNAGDRNISTLDSLKRLSGASCHAQPVSIPSSKSTSSAAPSQDLSDRRVRFSEVVEMKSPFREVPTQPVGSVFVHPDIETRMSDLTDNGEYTRARVSDPPQIEPIPEDVSEGEDLPEEDEFAIVEEAPLMNFNNTNVEQMEDAVEPVKRWSYTVGVGVTPMRKGADSSNATNSPMLRFQEARMKFAGSSTAPRKMSPVKCSSPVKRTVGGNIVSARIAAIIKEREKSQDQVITQKMWRPTSKGFAASDSKEMDEPMHVVGIRSADNSPDSTVAATVVNEERNRQVTHLSRNASPSDSDGSSDPFGHITHSKTFDEDSVSHDGPGTNFGLHPAEVCDDSDDEDEDAFAELLKEDQDDHTLSGTTVSTVHNEGRDYSAATAALLNSFASTQTQRISNCRSSVASSSSSTASDAKPRKRLSFASSSDSTATSTTYSNPVRSLTFRDEAPVRPSEQKNHRQVPGALVLSPMQRTPMQARKWRVLAAAAQEKDRKATGARRGSSLRERHPNVAA